MKFLSIFMKSTVKGQPFSLIFLSFQEQVNNSVFLKSRWGQTRRLPHNCICFLPTFFLIMTFSWQKRICYLHSTIIWKKYLETIQLLVYFVIRKKFHISSWELSIIACVFVGFQFRLQKMLFLYLLDMILITWSWKNGLQLPRLSPITSFKNDRRGGTKNFDRSTINDKLGG